MLPRGISTPHMKTFVLVSGDFTTWGGMDRANYELAWYLADQQAASVHLVSYYVAAPLADHPNVTWHRVPKPLDMYFLAEPLLAKAGYRVARTLMEQGARVIINGGNSTWPDVNWVHAVHAAWAPRHSHAPVHFRLRASWIKHKARRAERAAVKGAKVVLVNSECARRQVIEQVGMPPDRVRTVYYGIDPEVFRPASSEERLAARQRLGWQDSRPVVVFVGSLGHDRNKGFDVLFDAWKLLCMDSAWDVDLVALGGGVEVDLWRERAAAEGLCQRVNMIGFSKDVKDVLAAADALVSPTHYDAYGLGVHEALCCGLPAFVTRSAGVAERYPADLDILLLNDPPAAVDLVGRMRRWRSDMAGYSTRVAHFSRFLRQRTWSDMSREISMLIEAYA